MSKTIWKWEIPIDDTFTLELPAGSEPLYFGTQNDKLTLWVLVDPGQLPRECMFRLAGAGHPLPDETNADKYIGTAFLLGGAMVWHLFFLGWGSMAG